MDYVYENVILKDDEDEHIEVMRSVEDADHPVNDANTRFKLFRVTKAK